MTKKLKKILAVQLVSALVLAGIPVTNSYAYSSLPDELNGLSVTWTGGWKVNSKGQIFCNHGDGWLYDDGSIEFRAESNVPESVDELVPGTYEVGCGCSITLKLIHKHNITYFGDGASIIAYCTETEGADDCSCQGTESDLSKAAVLTVKASDARVSGGEYNRASLVNGDKFLSATKLESLPEINYEGRGETEYEKSTTAPTAAGTYTASITVDEQTAVADFEIKARATNKYTLTIPAETTVETYGYTELDGELNVTDADLDSNVCVVVKAETKPFECADNGGSIDYTLKCAEYDNLSDGIKWTATDAAGEEGKPVTLGIEIDQDDYINAPDGVYAGSIKWTAGLQMIN